jgi:hypothetical protein
MTRFYRTKTISMALVISGLLVLLPSCEKKGSAEKVGEKINNVVENIGEELDEAAKNASERLDEAEKNAGEKVE